MHFLLWDICQLRNPGPDIVAVCIIVLQSKLSLKKCLLLVHILFNFQHGEVALEL